MDNFEKVSSIKELRKLGGRKCLDVKGRNITLFLLKKIGQTQPNIYAIDSRCYHTGGPLWEGEIEDIGSKPYIICPWHKYVIGLEDGISILKGPVPTVKGLRQRTHQVNVSNSGDIFVKLSKMPGGKEEIPSDHYCPATDEEKRRMGLLKR